MPAYPGSTGQQMTMGQIEQAWIAAGGNPAWAPTMAAIAYYESGGLTNNYNDNAGTHDNSVGLFQINYYGNLAPGRTAEYGSPLSLANSVQAQMKAAIALLGNGSGITNWEGDHAAQQVIDNGNQPLSGTAAQQIVSSSGGGSYASSAGTVDNMTQADWQALYAAGQQGGTAYLQAAAAQAQTAGGSAGGSPTTNAPAESVTIGGQTYYTPAGDANAASQISAIGQMAATLASYGFSGGDLQTLTQWAWTEMTGNVDPSQVVLDLQTPGSAVYPIFDKQFPGFTAANQQLTAQGLQAVSVQQYQQYQTFATQTAQAMGLPPGFINSNDVGTLIGNNVSQTELSKRLTDAMVLAYQSTPEQQAMFNQYFGTQYASNNPFMTQGGTSATGTPLAGAVPSGHGPLTPGQIAALALDPNKAEPLIAQQIQAAQIGGASATSGVGALDAATATQLAQAGITTAAATSAFQNLAPLAALETARPGMGGEAAQGTVSANQLAVGNLLGNPQAQRQEQTAIEVAKAPFAGGGGPITTSKGAVGAGSANPNGTGTT